MKIFAFENINDEIRRESSSGGLFHLLAERIVEKGGIVFGAAFNANWNVEHIGIENVDDLKKLRKSKYVESDFLKTLPAVIEAVNSGRGVLFSGTPCQIAVLKQRVKTAPANLLTVEVVCHGVPKQEIWQRYLSELLLTIGKTKTDIVSIDFRDKSLGWRKFSFKIEFSDGSIYTEPYTENLYMKMFLKDYILKDGCFKCPFKQPNSKADISIGDLWGMEYLLPERNNDGGTSLVIANTIKGEEMLGDINSMAAFTLEEVSKYNPMLTTSAAMPGNYQECNDKLAKMKSFSRWARLTLKTPKVNKRIKVGILTQPLGHNYGGIIQNWALQQVFQKFGVKAISIKYYELQRFPKLRRYIYKKLLKYKRKLTQKWIPEKWEPQRLKEDCKNLRRFVRQHIKMTRYIPELNQNSLKRYGINNLVVGSDQVWRPIYNDPGLEYMFCDFVDDKTPLKCIAYAASFGVDEWELSPAQTEMAKRNMTKFSAVSVRERSGRQLCVENLGCNAEIVLDPTLLLDSNDYDSLLSGRLLTTTEEKCVGVYVLDKNDKKQKIIDLVCEQLKLKPIYFGVKNPDTGLFPGVEEWLLCFRNSSFIITDSFHGTVFSILYHKPFISVINTERGAARFDSLIGLLGLNNRLINENDAVHLKEVIDNPIDWQQVDEELAFYRDISQAFIESAIG